MYFVTNMPRIMTQQIYLGGGGGGDPRCTLTAVYYSTITVMSVMIRLGGGVRAMKRGREELQGSRVYQYQWCVCVC